MRGAPPSQKGYLHGVRILEIADELGEYAGKVLAGLGADVVKVEPIEGETTRGIGPFLGGSAGAERSLHFWHFNHGKRGVAIDVGSDEGQSQLASLLSGADVLIDTRPPGFLKSLGFGTDALAELNPRLIHARISPFGDDGPWSDYRTSDLVHLALGGVMMNCGYDPDPRGDYDTPPIAPQMWHSYHIAGEVTVMTILAALIERRASGLGQMLSTSVHDAVSMNTETDLPDWIYLRQPHYRLTCRHSMVSKTVPAIAITKDGRYVMPYRTYLAGRASTSTQAWDQTVRVLNQFKMADGITGGKYDHSDYRLTTDATDRLADLTNRMLSQTLFSADVWRVAQAEGLTWAPVRKPEENVDDPHWQMRGAFADVEHPELGQSFTYIGARWYSEDAPWTVGGRAPLLGEHNAAVFAEWGASTVGPTGVDDRFADVIDADPAGRPFPLAGTRVIDLSWMLASAGAGRFLASMGADVIKVEHASRPDGMRFGQGAFPRGGRAERDAATSPIATPSERDLDSSGAFMEINAGKRAISLNLKSAEGIEILEGLIRGADMVVEGFSPGTMERMGLGYERLRELNPSIIYIQQSGLGDFGLYGRARTFGPTAQAFTGISEMSGLPEPFPPAGIGYSYLDWFGAYNMATAMIAALYRHRATGEGCHIDASQGEIGLYLTGTAVLDHSVNKRKWLRFGNRSPYKRAAPHGAFPVAGKDRWVVIACFNEQEWRATLRVLECTELADDARFQTLESRLEHQSELEALISDRTRNFDGYDLMNALQHAGVAAGVCQDAEDRVERDPQLKSSGWLEELPQRSHGMWPIKVHPVKMSRSSTWVGGKWARSGPDYGQDTTEVLRDLLNLSEARIDELREQGVV